ncbi:MAG: nucleotidyl transferase AbiEii/AbiGii toxin family protein [Candidatus Beckwithbacteria bacterium]|nr:nucleotidyl transferase AbiEii/AbiGii toxin family protein [Patescibacteria group bacterium]
MDQVEIRRLSQELQISPVEIIREEVEMVTLEYLSQSKAGRNLIFKGGTALRLCYQSPRFSQDLDFNQKGRLMVNEVKEGLVKLTKDNQEISLKDWKNKRNTLFGLLLVKSEWIKQAFSIKIEISKKKYRYKTGDYGLKVCRSLTSQLSPLFYVYSLERILKEKKMAIKSRLQPRDYFDAWLVAEKLGLSLSLPKPKIHSSKFKGEINQLLPDKWKHWSSEFLSQYE